MPTLIKEIAAILVSFSLAQATYAQIDTTLLNKRLRNIVLAEVGLYAVSATTLGWTWYSKFDRSSWHWFDDSKEWLQIDKAGHAYAGFQTARLAYEIHNKAGFSNKKSTLWGAMASFIAVGSIEFFDGFATNWGASISDLAANTFGVGLFVLQQGVINKQIVKYKISYHPTNLYKLNPRLLGNNFAERILKDYNAHQFWLSINIHDIVKLDNMPKWLNIAVGYGAYNMISANTDRVSNAEYQPYRRFFISPDIDLEKIKTRSNFVRFALKTLNMIKIPMPTVEFNKNTTKCWIIY